jgi:hypothetical protein
VDKLTEEATRLRLKIIALGERKNLLDLRGKIEFAPGYDYKELRNRES